MDLAFDHRPRTMSSGLLGVMLMVGAILGLAAFALMIALLRGGASLRSLDFIVAGMTVFFLSFPLVIALVTPRRNDPRGTL